MSSLTTSRRTFLKAGSLLVMPAIVRAAPSLSFFGKKKAGSNGLLAGTVGYWTMDEIANNAADSTGNGFTAVETGTMNPFAGGVINGCRGNINAGSGSGFSVSSTIDNRAASTAFTVAFWLNDAGASGAGGVAMSVWNGGTDCWVIRCDSGEKPKFSAYNSSGVNDTIITWGSDLPINAWSFIAAGFDGTKSWISVNAGTRVTTTPANVRRGGSPLVFLNYSGFVNNWPGKIDEISYCTKARSDADLSLIYNGGNGLPFSSYT